MDTIHLDKGASHGATCIQMFAQGCGTKSAAVALAHEKQQRPWKRREDGRLSQRLCHQRALSTSSPPKPAARAGVLVQKSLFLTGYYTLSCFYFCFMLRPTSTQLVSPSKEGTESYSTPGERRSRLSDASDGFRILNVPIRAG